jgi:hypothetical protein
MLRHAVALFAVLGAVAGLGAACSGDDDIASATPSTSLSTTTTATSRAPTTTTTTLPATSTTAVPPATTLAPPPTPQTTVPSRPPYAAAIATIDVQTQARMTYSWRAGCPVGLEDLRLLTLPHWDDAGRSATGELVVHADVADAVVEAFRRLYENGFPIARMELVDVYQGDDDASMRANNTSAFNCREIDGRPGTWSQHSYGRAIDVNPLVNPWVRGSQVDPPEGAPYADRSVPVPGGIYAGDSTVAAFAAIGWKWGGNWSTSKDYQHFSANGR